MKCKKLSRTMSLQNPQHMPWLKVILRRSWSCCSHERCCKDSLKVPWNGLWWLCKCISPVAQVLIISRPLSAHCVKCAVLQGLKYAHHERPMQLNLKSFDNPWPWALERARNDWLSLLTSWHWRASQQYHHGCWRHTLTSPVHYCRN